MITRIILSVIVGIITAFVFWLVGTLFAPIAPQIADILIKVSYWAGIISGLLFFVSGREKLI